MNSFTKSVAFNLLVTLRTHGDKSSEVHGVIYRHSRADSLSKRKLLEVTYASVSQMYYIHCGKINEIWL